MKRGKFSVRFQNWIPLSGMIVVLFILAGLGNVFGQASYSAEGDYKKPGSWIFKGGMTGSVGFSILSLSNNLRPEFASEEFFEFSPDYFAMVGAIVHIQPGFLSRRWAFVTDPSFAKYSYGNGKKQTTGEIDTEIDIDAEMLRAPFSVQYYFTNPTAKMHPFVRIGYAYSYLIENKAYFSSHNTATGEKLYDSGFDYAKSQNSFSFSLGSEVNIGIGNFSFEIVGEMGDGIHSSKDSWNFQSDSRTSSLYLRLGILF